MAVIEHAEDFEEYLVPGDAWMSPYDMPFSVATRESQQQMHGLGANELVALTAGGRVDFLGVVRDFTQSIAELPEFVRTSRRGGSEDKKSTEQANLVHIVESIAADMVILREDIERRPVVKSATIHDLNSPGLSLACPVHITLEEYEEEIVASWPEIEAMGSGDSDGSAIMALKFDIVEHYEHLAATDDERLGPLLLSQKRALLSVVRIDETP